MATPTLVTRDVLAALDAAGVRCEVIDTDAGYTVLRFDHVALDRLGAAIGDTSDIDWDDCPNCETSVSKLVELREELADLQRTVRGYGSLVGAAKAFIAEVEAS